MPNPNSPPLETHRQIEQIRLVLGSAHASAIPMVLVSLVLVWTLHHAPQTHQGAPLMLVQSAPTAPHSLEEWCAVHGIRSECYG
jgi:hypothetical protein